MIQGLWTRGWVVEVWDSRSRFSKARAHQEKKVIEGLYWDCIGVILGIYWGYRGGLGVWLKSGHDLVGSRSHYTAHV